MCKQFLKFPQHQRMYILKKNAKFTTPKLPLNLINLSVLTTAKNMTDPISHSCDRAEFMFEKANRSHGPVSWLAACIVSLSVSLVLLFHQEDNSEKVYPNDPKMNQ